MTSTDLLHQYAVRIATRISDWEDERLQLGGFPMNSLSENTGIIMGELEKVFEALENCEQFLNHYREHADDTDSLAHQIGLFNDAALSLSALKQPPRPGSAG